MSWFAVFVSLLVAVSTYLAGRRPEGLGSKKRRGVAPQAVRPEGKIKYLQICTARRIQPRFFSIYPNIPRETPVLRDAILGSGCIE